MPPSATLCQSAPDAAVGRSAKTRNVVGSTPSIATNFPLTWIRAASTNPAATTPGTRRTAASPRAGSDWREITSTSARSSLPSGLAPGGCAGSDPRGAGSIIVAELSRTEPCPAGVAPRWADRPADEGQAAPIARRASAAQPTGAARRIQARAGPNAGARDVTQASIPTPSPLYRITQCFPQRGRLGDRDQASEVPAHIGGPGTVHQARARKQRNAGHRNQ